MSILIASDIHGSSEAVAFLKSRVEKYKPELLLLLGDILYHGPRNPLPNEYDPKDVAKMFEDFPVSIMAVRGNCDSQVDQMVLPFYLAEEAWVSAQGKQILALHGHQLPEFSSSATLPGIAPNTVILSGHTHIPVNHTKGDLTVWNPGSTTLPKGGFPPSYALLHEGIFTVMDFQDRQLNLDPASKSAFGAN